MFCFKDLIWLPIFYVTAKAEVKLAGTTPLRECQFRELIAIYDLGSYRYLLLFAPLVVCFII